MKGIVKWFDEIKGFGFIINDEDQKEYFFHFSDIQKTGFKSLSENQKVEFEIKQDLQNRDRATKVTAV